ncbi:hypothetical protein [Actinoplanes sp. NPDC049118]|uniref:hypothetical protein n=1 Tax=Actinoplanes sp. NPDC049118 TaxID=3155769 RepID=UPI003403C9D3
MTNKASDTGGTRNRLGRRLAVAALPLALALVTAPSAAKAAAPDDGPTASAAGNARGNPRAFAFLSRSKPTDPIARWNPCKPINYRVNLDRSRAGALKDVKGAIQRIHQATGLRFVYRGATKVIPDAKRGYPGRYPADTDLVIAWASPGKHSTQIPKNAGRLAGRGGAAYLAAYTGTGERTAMYVKGLVVLNAAMRLPAGFGAGDRSGTRGQLLMHEIGHAVGLAHPRINDKKQIMYPVILRKTAVWGAGDLNGLRALGRSRGCLYLQNPAAASISSRPHDDHGGTPRGSFVLP